MADNEELHDDDTPVGRLLSRREALALFGGAGAALIAGLGVTRIAFAQAATATATGVATPTATATALPSCVVRPALTEGPYFVDGILNRSDIRSDSTQDIVKDGMPFLLAFQVMDVTDATCKPLAGAQVDIWHCDAYGVYSGASDPGFDTTGQDWLRGYQITDETGMAKFLTIYPGWYAGRAVHIHFKIRTDPEAELGYEFTSQLFFDDVFSEEIYQLQPYNNGRGEHDTPNEEDNIFQNSEGLLTLALTELTEDELEDVNETSGYGAIFAIGLDLSVDTSAQSKMGGGRDRRPPGGGG